MLERTIRQYSTYVVGLTGILLFTSTSLAAPANTQISGTVEGEFTFGEDVNGVSSSNIALATAEVALDADLSEWVSAHLLLLHEEDDTPLEVDEGIIEFGNSFLSAFSLQLGQLYVPFGAYETNLISDPLTLEIGEARESAAVIRYDNRFKFAVYLFNGDINKADTDDAIDNFGITLGYLYEGEDLSIELSLGLINNIGESDGLSGVITENLPDSSVVEYVSAITSHLIIEWGPLVFISELVAANDEFAAGEIYQNRASKPSASNLEVAYNINDTFSVAAAVQQSVDVSGILPETRTLFGIGYTLNASTSLALEFSIDTDYGTNSPNGTGQSASNMTLQLSTAF